MADDPVKTIDDVELKDHRRKSKCPEGMVVGSNEYWRWWRQNNVGRNKLYQRRAYLRRRKLTIAVDRADTNETLIEDELREVDEQIAALREFSKNSKVVPKIPLSRLVEKHPWVEEEAARYNVPYEIAEKVMLADDYRGDETWQEFLLTYPPPDEEA